MIVSKSVLSIAKFDAYALLQRSVAGGVRMTTGDKQNFCSGEEASLPSPLAGRKARIICEASP